jgi:hypothetical protein
MKYGPDYGAALQEMMLAHNALLDADEGDDWPAYNTAIHRKREAEEIIKKYELQE